MTLYLRSMMICILLFAMIDISGAVNDLPFKRIISAPDTTTTGAPRPYDTPQNVEYTMDELVYMNVDALVFSIPSEYVEAHRNPSRCSWDYRACPNDSRSGFYGSGKDMAQYVIDAAHEHGIKAYAYITINVAMTPGRAEYRLWGGTNNNGNYYTNYNTRAVDGKAFLPNRLEIANKTVQDYEIGLVTHIVSQYPKLDGLDIEEPFYVSASYSPEIVNRVKAKFNNYNIINKADNLTLCYNTGNTWNPAICPTFSKIYSVTHDIFFEFFTTLNAQVKSNTSNPNFILSASGPSHYRPSHGFDPENLSDNRLLDWYILATADANLGSWKRAIENSRNEINEIPIVPAAFITWSGLYPNGNQEFINEIRNTCAYGGDVEFVYAYWHRNRITNTTAGLTARTELHNLLPNSACGGYVTSVADPTFTPLPGTYSSAINVYISTSTAGATIRYTTDGTTPSETSRIYTSAIPISSTTTLKARAFKTNLTPSFVNTATYTITPSQPITNLINNPGFESGNTSWMVYPTTSIAFSTVSPGTEGNYSAKISFSSIPVDIQLYQPNIKTLEPNSRYKLSFSAYSTTGHDLRVRLNKTLRPYTNYGLDSVIDLGVAWKDYSVEFNTNITSIATDGCLQFYFYRFAEITDIYYIDNVKLEKVMVNYSISDLNNDGVVDKRDLDLIFIHFNENVNLLNPNYDVKNDGMIDIFDLVKVTNNIR